MNSMLALVKPRPQTRKPWEKGLRLVERPIPQIQSPNEVKIRVLKAGICGTDVGIYNSKESFRVEMISSRQKDVVLGHEFCGEIEEAGEMARRQLARLFKERFGDYHTDPDLEAILPYKSIDQLYRHPDFLDFLKEKFYVTAEMHIVCGVCYACRTGNSHICRNTIIKGLQQDGAFAQYVTVPSQNIILIKKGEIPAEIVAFMDAIGNAVHTTQTVSLMGTSIAILGMGVQGLMATAIARRSGATLIVVTDFSTPQTGFTHEKLQNTRFHVARLAGARFRFDMALLGEAERLVKTVMRETGGLGVDVVLEMSGNPLAYQDALNIVRMGGTICLLGIPSQEVTINFSEKVILYGLTIKGIIGRRMYETWEKMIQMLKSGLAEEFLKNGYITHTFPLSDFEKAFEAHRRGEAIKVLLLPE